MPLYGLIGYPLTHSFSQKYFAAKFQKEGLLSCAFENFEIKDISLLPELISSNPSLLGLSVTIPYKEAVLSYLNNSDPIVKEVGACNCVKITGGKLFGYNTDVSGFESSLRTRLLPHHNKALTKRDLLSDTFTYNELSEKDIAEYPLLINCTPSGMFPDVNSCPPLPYEAITSNHFLFDLTYNPAKTLFLQKGEAKGALIQNGYDMLVTQAEESWAIWNS